MTKQNNGGPVTTEDRLENLELNVQVIKNHLNSEWQRKHGNKMIVLGFDSAVDALREARREAESGQE